MLHTNTRMHTQWYAHSSLHSSTQIQQLINDQYSFLHLSCSQLPSLALSLAVVCVRRLPHHGVWGAGLWGHSSNPPRWLHQQGASGKSPGAAAAVEHHAWQAHLHLRRLGRAGHCTGTGVFGWCIVTVMECTGHCTGTGVWGSLVHCHCGGMCRSPYWNRCAGVVCCHWNGMCRSLYWNRCVWVVHCHCGGMCRSPSWNRCVRVVCCHWNGMCRSLYWNRCVWVVHCHCGGTHRSLYWDRCVGVTGALLLWWDAHVTILGQVCGGRCCIVTVVGQAGHHTGTGVWGLLVYCRCGGTSRSQYWDRCVGVAGALPLWWDVQVTVLGQVCGGCWCIAAVVRRAGHRTGTGVWGSLVHCRCGGMSRSLYWNRCVRVGGAFSLRWGEQVTILE